MRSRRDGDSAFVNRRWAGRSHARKVTSRAKTMVGCEGVFAAGRPIAALTKLVVFTHEAPHRLMLGHTRYKTDEAIRVLARNGGEMGLGSIRFMSRPEALVTAEHVVDHSDYTIRLVGAKHVGIGSDLD